MNRTSQTHTVGGIASDTLGFPKMKQLATGQKIIGASPTPQPIKLKNTL